MNKLFSKIAALSVGLAMAIGVGVAVGSKKAAVVKADNITISYSDISGITSTAGDQTGTASGFTFHIENGLINGHMRVYKSKYLEITAPANYDLKQIVFTCTASGTAQYGPGCFVLNSSGTYEASEGTTGTWSGTAESVKLTASSNQVRITTFEITYEAQATTDPKITLSKNSLFFINGGAAQALTATPNSVFTSTPTLSVASTPSYVNVSFDGLNISVSPKGVGTENVTITATEGTKVASATLAIRVVSTHGYVSTDPFTVAEAIAAIDAGIPSSDKVYVGGIISQIDTTADKFKGQICYWISDDGKTTTQFEIYWGKNVGNVDFTNLSDIAVGASVVNYGGIKKYNSTYEFDSGSYLSSYTAPVRALVSIAVSNQKTDYKVGDTFVKPTVTATYDDESQVDVTSLASFSGFDSSAVAESQTITVTYSENEVEKTTSYQISIAPVQMYTYRKVESELTDYSGKYLIVYEGDSEHDACAFKGSLTTLDATENKVDVTISDNTIQLAGGYEFTISAIENGYSIKSSSDYYIGNNSDSNGLSSSTSEVYLNTISVNDGVADIRSSGGAHLRFNYASNQLRFRYFKTASYQGQQPVALYRLADAESFASLLMSETNASCSAYAEADPTSTSTTAYTNIWSLVKPFFTCMNDDEKEILTGAQAKKSGTTIEMAMYRYDHIVSKYGVENFMVNRELSHVIRIDNAYIANDNTMIIVIVIAAVSALAFTTLLVFKKKKQK